MATDTLLMARTRLGDLRHTFHLSRLTFHGSWEDFFSILLDNEEGEAKYAKSAGHLALLAFNR